MEQAADDLHDTVVEPEDRGLAMVRFQQPWDTRIWGAATISSLTVPSSKILRMNGLTKGRFHRGLEPTCTKKIWCGKQPFGFGGLETGLSNNIRLYG